MLLIQNLTPKWNRREDPEINSLNDSHLILVKGTKNTCWRKGSLFNKYGAGKSGYPHVED
jgi:hypothetical protein